MRIPVKNYTPPQITQKEQQEKEDKKTILPFSKSNLWIRIVDKRKKMSTLIKGANNIDNVSSEQKMLLNQIFLNEVGTYGDMMFNISSLEAARWWKFRNNLSPILNSVLFTPQVTVSSVEEDQEDQQLVTNNPLAVYNATLYGNDNLNYTQIENLQNVLNKIADKKSSYPSSNLDLNNQIRIQNFEVKWLTEAFTTREAKLVVYIEHEQLMKTKAIEYLMTINNRLRISTQFLDMFGGDKVLFNKFISSFSQDNQWKLESEQLDLYDEYQSIINASAKDSELDEWVIYNFSTEFNDDMSLKLTIELISPGYSVTKRFDTIQPIQVLNTDVVKYFQEKGFMKVSTSKSSKLKDGTIYIPVRTVNNPANITAASKNTNQNKEIRKTHLVFDASNFVLHMLWLYAWELKQSYDKTNPDKLNSNFLVTFEVDLSLPKKDTKSNERFNGALVTKFVDDNNNHISWFNFDKLSKVIEDNTDCAFQYNSEDSGSQLKYLWNFEVNEKNESKLLQKQENVKIKNLMSQYPQTTLIEEVVTNWYELSDGSKVSESQLNALRTQEKNNEKEKKKFDSDKLSYALDTINKIKFVEKKGGMLIPYEDIEWGTWNLIRVKGDNREFPSYLPRKEIQKPTDLTIQYNIRWASFYVNELYKIANEINERWWKLQKKHINNYPDWEERPVQYVIEDKRWKTKKIIHLGFSQIKYEKYVKNLNELLLLLNMHFDLTELFGPLRVVPKSMDTTEQHLLSLEEEAFNKFWEDYLCKSFCEKRSASNSWNEYWQLLREYFIEQRKTTTTVDLYQNIIPLKPSSTLYRNYLYPIFIVSTQDEAWLQRLKTPIQKFTLDIISEIFNYRREAMKYYAIEKIEDKEDKEWYDNWNRRKTNKLKENEGTENRTNKIDSQIDNIAELSLNVAIHDYDYVKQVDASFKDFIEKMTSSDRNNKKWIEIIISDSTKHIMTKEEYDVFFEIQKNVFEGLDKNSVAINRYYDNNIISLQTQSETVSDLPYQLGAFSPHERTQDSFEEKLKTIRSILTGDSTFITQLDKSKLNNVISMMELMSKNDGSSESNIDNIVKWVQLKKDDEDSTKLYNSISGSDFFSDLSKLGMKKKHIMSLFDSLLFKANGQSYYVPDLKVYAPLTIYSAFDSSTAIQKAINSNGLLSRENIYDLNSRISPQTGIYKITELSYSIDEYGLWTHNWQAVKLDYGFMNFAHKIIYDEIDIKESIYSNIKQFDSERNNFFDSSIVLSDKFLNWSEFSISEFPESSVGTFDHPYRSNYITNLLDKKTNYSQIIPNNYFEPIYTNVAGWKVPNNFITSYFYSQKKSMFSIENYMNWQPDWWFKISDLKYLNFLQELNSAIPRRYNEPLKNNIITSLMSNWDFFTRSEKEPYVGDSTNSITSKKRVKIDKDKGSANIDNNLDTGTVITISRYDHPSISPDLTLDSQGILGTKDIMLYDKIKINDTVSQNYGWRTIEKYIIVDFPLFFKIFSKNSTSKIRNLFSTKPTEALYFWEDYVEQSVNINSLYYEWLKNNQLDYAMILSQENLDIEETQFLELKRYAMHFLTNFFDVYNINEPFTISPNQSTSSFSISFTTEKKDATEHKKYTEYYQSYIEWDHFKSAVNNLIQWESMQQLFECDARNKLEKFASSTGFFYSVNGDEIEGKKKLQDKWNDFKLDMRAQIITDIMPKFLDEWLTEASKKWESYSSIHQLYKSRLDTMWFDFILINSSNLKQTKGTCRFSAIRWDYVNNKTGFDFVSNISMEQIFDATSRKEHRIVAVKEDDIRNETDYSTRIYDKWIYEEPEYSLKEYPKDKNKPQTLEAARAYYGRMDMIIDNSTTKNNCVISEERCGILDAWNYSYHGITHANGYDIIENEFLEYSESRIQFSKYFEGWNCHGDDNSQQNRLAPIKVFSVLYRDYDKFPKLPSN